MALMRNAICGEFSDAGPRPVEPGLGSECQLRAAYAAHGAELYRFALRRLGDEGAAQDVVQEVFLRAWRRADTFDPAVASLRVWLFAIARNAVVDETRQLAARPWRRNLTDNLDDCASTVDSGDAGVVDARVVQEALGRVSVDHRRAVVATYLGGRPYLHVAAELGIPVGTLRTRVFYGLRALRLVLDEMGVVR
jgi:RNA polymerase sigma-70 factor (ECF subfamily)